LGFPFYSSYRVFAVLQEPPDTIPISFVRFNGPEGHQYFLLFIYENDRSSGTGILIKSEFAFRADRVIAFGPVQGTGTHRAETERARIGHKRNVLGWWSIGVM
jgi:hypothetical protein